MKRLLEYLNGLSKEQRQNFVLACGTTEGYLRKAVSVEQQLSAELCILIDRESAGAVPCDYLRPDIDWAYVRATVGDPAQGIEVTP